MKDKDLLITEDHELNYMLKQFNKIQNPENREMLISIIDKFKRKKYNRKKFLKYYYKNKKIGKLLQ